MLSYYNDKTIRFDHTPVVHKSAFKINQVGVDDPYVFPVVDYTASDTNTIWLDSDSVVTSTGDYDAPYTSLATAITATTSSRTKVCALNDATYNEDISGCTYTYFQGVYNTSSGTASWVGRQLGYTPSDSNTIYVSKTGGDGNAGTAAAPKLTIAGAIAACDATHQAVMILDSETYSEDGFDFTGNYLKLYAAIGESPIIEVERTDDHVDGTSFASVKTKTLLFDDTFITGISATKMTNGNVMIAWRDGTGAYPGSYMVVDPDGTTVISGTQYDSAGALETRLLQHSSGKIMLAWRDSGGTVRYRVYNADMTDYKTEAQLVGVASTKNILLEFTTAVPGLHDIGDIYVGYADGAVGKYIILDKDDFATVVASGNIGVPGTGYPYYCGCVLENGYIAFGRTNGSTAEIYGYVHDDSLNNVVGATPLGSTGGTKGYADQVMCISINSDIVMYVYPNTYEEKIYYVVVRALTMGVLVDRTECMAAATADQSLHQPAIAHTGDGTIMILSTEYNVDYKPYYVIINGLSFYGLSNDAAATINGVSLTVPDDSMYLTKFISATARLDIDYCDIYGATANHSSYDCVAISSDSHVDFTHSKLRDSDIGIDTTENTSTITDSQFYRINNGYAIDIDGAAASEGDITIEHCDILDSYGGIYLLNNDGDNETIKNNIFYDCDVYDINAETSVTVNNTVYTDSNTGVTVGDYLVRANPLYYNTGYNNTDDTDLQVKAKILGYQTDSPAIDLADDDRNAGSIDVVYIGTETSWTSITVPKPQIIPIQGTFAGATNTQRSDGSYSSYKDGQSEVVTMRWVALKQDDFDLIKTMWMSSTATVRIYPDPVTYPNNYATYTLLRNSLNMGTVFVTVSEFGVQTVELTFAKAL